jgi:hypothetical protein
MHHTIPTQKAYLNLLQSYLGDLIIDYFRIQFRHQFVHNL